jgi:hypothetical protein
MYLSAAAMLLLSPSVPSEFQASKVGLIMADRVNAVGNEVPAL